jgi:TonB family protein
VYFLKNDGRFVEKQDSADFVRVVREPDSGSVYYNILEFYKNGKRKFIGKSSKIEAINLQGQGIEFFGNGNKKTLANYKDNQFIGTVYSYYKSGKLYSSIDYKPDSNAINSDEISGSKYKSILINECRDTAGHVLVEKGNGHFISYHSDFSYIEEEGDVVNGKREGIWHGKDLDYKITFSEVYRDGEFLSGESTDSAGIKHAYTKRLIAPQYPGGPKALYEYLGSHIVYPDYARAHDIQGTVILSFVIKKDGTLSDIKVFKPVDKLLDNEAIRVLKHAKLWQCGMHYGLPVNVVYTIPVKFALSE